MDHLGESLMAMVYQKGSVYEKGKRSKKWYGKFRIYMTDREGEEVERTRRVVLGLKSELRKYEAEEKLQAIVRRENGCEKGNPASTPQSDDSVTFEWFVAERLQWKSYAGDRLIIHSTAYEGRLYEEKVKTEASRESVPIPEDIRPVIEVWRHLCPDTSPEALMFPTYGRRSRTGIRSGKSVPRQAKNFLKWRIWPIADKLGIPRKLVTFQVMRRTLGTDLQQQGTMKDAQQILRHASIRTTANVYMQQIPASVVAAINSRTRAILAGGKTMGAEVGNTTGSNPERGSQQVPKKNGSSGRTRTRP
jgi:hypothetical protein